VKTLDFTGLAQKNGAVVAHVQIAVHEADLDVVRIPLGTADVMLAADIAVGCQVGVLERNARSAAVIGNLDLAATADFKRDGMLSIDAALHRRTIEMVTDAGRSVWLHGVRLAERLFGNAQAMNTMLLGLAWQRGLVPVGEGAILRAIELNGASVGLNRRAFLWGRILAEQPGLMEEILTGVVVGPPLGLDALVAHRAGVLTAYQSKRYARRYRSVVQEVVERETSVLGSPGRLARAAAEGLFRVMAYKDEYEVARLHAAATYGEKPAFHMSPPLVGRIDTVTGRRRKIAIPGWVALPLFRALRHGKVVRGSVVDPFGYQSERRAEVALIASYIADLRMALARLRPDNVDTAVGLAELPDQIRGFGPVKDASRAKAAERREQLVAALSRHSVAIAAE
jgi:indolepyruvate ferredoxin oxidoreductase